MIEALYVNIDGVTYRMKRRKMAKTGKPGFFLQTGGYVHGRMSFIQVLVIDVPQLTEHERLEKRARNRARKLRRLMG